MKLHFGTPFLSRVQCPLRQSTGATKHSFAVLPTFVTLLVTEFFLFLNEI